MMRTHPRDEFELLVRIERDPLRVANERGQAAAFVRNEPVLPAA
jgi:hypothetical protein